MFDINIKTNVREIERALNDFAYKQMPKAVEAATNSVAKKIAVAQVANMQKVLDRPTPFTLKSVGVRLARKQNNYTATIYIKDLAASYLEPYEFGGVNKLNGRALLDPVDAKTNQYGNLPRNMLAQLKNRKDIFIGVVKGKNGQQINGVWQRPFIRKNQKIRGKSIVPKGSNTTGHLKLLIRFEDAHPVKQHLGWRALAAAMVKKLMNREIGTALARAIAIANK
ncbi:MAG: hypothetical protein HKM00_09530 [Gallionella sp.]|nr:hypothetical protein [Gallionella sp.]